MKLYSAHTHLLFELLRKIKKNFKKKREKLIQRNRLGAKIFEPVIYGSVKKD